MPLTTLAEAGINQFQSLISCEPAHAHFLPIGKSQLTYYMFSDLIEQSAELSSDPANHSLRPRY